MKAIYIEWDEEVSVFEDWHYVGNGVSDPIFRIEKIVRSARYSGDVTEEMIDQAKDWIRTQRPEGRIVIK